MGPVLLCIGRMKSELFDAPTPPPTRTFDHWKPMSPKPPSLNWEFVIWPVLVVRSRIFWPGEPPTAVAPAVAVAGVAAAAVAGVAVWITWLSRFTPTEPLIPTSRHWNPTLEGIAASRLFG